MTEAPETTLTDGSPVTDDHRDLKANGQQKGYVVLSEEERAKGFVRSVRTSYKHVGTNPKYDLLPLTEAQQGHHAGENYVGYEKYPAERHPALGRYWTQEQLDSGCGSVTTMSIEIAETYARQPKFYGSTFCGACGTHIKVEEFVWEGTNEIVGS